ncbi:glycosyltransferase family 8 protein [Helicobacter himalayensis]|uniref:glycosyltransferase family 8 protein n=1 Tax=Helicobacter himalayensis TaxID=1591088 RepID=UPI003D6E385C
MDNNPFCFHILTSDRDKPTTNKLLSLQTELNALYPCEIKIHHINEQILLKTNTKYFGAESQKSMAGYYRILVGDILESTIDKCLYMDADLLVLSDIRELFAIDFDEPCAAVCDEYANHKRFIKSKKTDKRLKISANNYFNSGLMLINLKQWRKQNIQSQTLDTLTEYECAQNDQDAMNYVINEKFYRLSPKWNLQTFLNMHHKQKDRTYLGETKNNLISWSRQEYEEASQNPKIFHLSAHKPWHSKYKTLGLDYKPYLQEPYRNMWQDLARATPIFGEELSEVMERAKCYEFDDYMEALSKKLLQRDARVERLYSILRPFKILKKVLRF